MPLHHGRFEVTQSYGVVQVRDRSPQPTWAKITSGSNPYAWQEVYDSSGASFTDWTSARSGTTTSVPAYEVNGNTQVPADSIVRIFPGIGHDAYYFDYADPDLTTNNITVNNLTVNNSLFLNSETYSWSVQQNNLALVDGTIGMRISLTSAAVSLTGIAAPSDSRFLLLYNDCSSDYCLTIVHDSPDSTAANRAQSTTGTDITIFPCSFALLYYDLTAARWLVTPLGQGSFEAKDEATGGADVDPGQATTIRLTGGTELSGFSGGCCGRRLRVINAAGADYTLLHEAGSQAQNQLSSFTSDDLVLLDGESVDLEYDCSISMWRIIGHCACDDSEPGDDERYDVTVGCCANPIARTLTGVIHDVTGDCTCLPGTVTFEYLEGAGHWFAEYDECGQCAFILECQAGGTTCSSWNLHEASCVGPINLDSCSCDPFRLVFSVDNSGGGFTNCTGTFKITITEGSSAAVAIGDPIGGSTAGQILSVDADGNLTQVSSASDGKVKVSSNDTTADYLGTKLVAGPLISLTENNDGANETLTINLGGTTAGGRLLIGNSSGGWSINPLSTGFSTIAISVGDGTISLDIANGARGDITVSSNGTVWTIDDDVVTYAKMQDVSAASRLLGRGSAAGAGDPEEITLGATLSMSGTTLSVTNVPDGDFGDISVSGGTWMLDLNVVSNGKLRDSAACSVIGRSANSSGDPADIQLNTNGHYLRRLNNVLGSGPLPTASSAETVLGGDFSIGAANGTWTEVYNSSSGSVGDFRITLPSAGTYEIDVDARGQINMGNGTLGLIAIRLYNVTDGAAIADSERLVVLKDQTGEQFQATCPIQKKAVTVTASKVIAVQAKRDGDVTTWTASGLGKDSNGCTTFGYTKTSD